MCTTFIRINCYEFHIECWHSSYILIDTLILIKEILPPCTTGRPITILNIYNYQLAQGGKKRLQTTFFIKLMIKTTKKCPLRDAHANALRLLFIKPFGCFKPSCKSNGCVSNRSRPDITTIFWIMHLTIITDPMYHLIVRWEKPHLYWSTDKIWSEASNKNKQSEKPIRWCRGTSFNKDLISTGWYGRIHGSIGKKEYIPENNATPYENMLYVSEVIYG